MVKGVRVLVGINIYWGLMEEQSRSGSNFVTICTQQLLSESCCQLFHCCRVVVGEADNQQGRSS